MKVATCRIPEVTSPCQALGAASLTCVAARQFVCHKHVCKGPFLASPKIKIFGRTTRTTSFGEKPPPSAQPSHRPPLGRFQCQMGEGTAGQGRQARLPADDSPPPESLRVNPQNNQADGNTTPGHHRLRDIGIHQRLQVMDQEWLMIGLNSGALLEPLLGHGQGAGPGTDFDHNAINQREDVEPAQQGPVASHQPAKDHPEDPDQMYRQGCNREYSIQIQHCAYLSAAMQQALLFPFLSRFGNVAPSQRGALGAPVGAPEQPDFGS